MSNNAFDILKEIRPEELEGMDEVDLTSRADQIFSLMQSYLTGANAKRLQTIYAAFGTTNEKYRGPVAIRGDLEVFADSEYGYWAQYKGKLVYGDFPERVAIPGPWWAAIGPWYQEALEVQKQRESEAHEEKLRRLRSRFCLAEVAA
jgi:hypothetical protein